jgi:hypothetical protein
MKPIDLSQIVSTLKTLVGLASVAFITVACVRAFGVDVPYFKMTNLDIAALSIAAAFVSKS